MTRRAPPLKPEGRGSVAINTAPSVRDRALWDPAQTGLRRSGRVPRASVGIDCDGTEDERPAPQVR
jgi:hypothetical protein